MPKDLPKDLEDFMQSSGEHGVVLIAFGSAVCNMDQVIVERILTAISRMKQSFIWKLKCEFVYLFILCLMSITIQHVKQFIV